MSLQTMSNIDAVFKILLERGYSYRNEATGCRFCEDSLKVLSFVS